ncbi:MAG: alpha/beta fold hydrolase [Planctomycetes bacterium]|nr:alpha/beta fold hydrolase [Planctomycetota bacterium]
MPADLEAEYPFESRFLAVDGGRLHYVDEGPRDAPVVLCLHGNPTWSFYWRALVKGLSDRWRVVALDHLGCGLSDKPQDWSYVLAAHVANVEALASHLALDRVTLAVHDWGGAIGMGFARRHPERVRRLVITNTAAFASDRMPWRIRVCRTPLVGEFLVRRLNAFAGLAPRMASARRGGIGAVARRGLLFPYDRPAHRVAIARFVQDIPMSSAHPSWNELAATDAALAGFADRPASIVWGERDWCFSKPFYEEWRRRLPQAESVLLPHAGHYVMEDAGDEVVRRVRAFLERTEAPRA